VEKDTVQTPDSNMSLAQVGTRSSILTRGVAATSLGSSLVVVTYRRTAPSLRRVRARTSSLGLKVDPTLCLDLLTGDFSCILFPTKCTVKFVVTERLCSLCRTYAIGMLRSHEKKNENKKQQEQRPQTSRPWIPARRIRSEVVATARESRRQATWTATPPHVVAAAAARRTAQSRRWR
jgi:hypothetical protein